MKGVQEKMTVLIVEDEPNYSDTLEMFVDELGYEVSGVATGAKTAVRLFEQERPDLVLMDIQLEGDVSGIDLAEMFQSTRPTPIIFITSFDDKDTFLKAKATAPYAYLVKPFDPDTLERSMELAVQKAYSGDEKVFDTESAAVLAPSCFFVKERNRLIKVDTHEILWVEVEDKYCTLDTGEKRFSLRQSLKELAEKLNPNLFVQTHRSYLVNAKEIGHIDTHLYVVRVREKEIPLGRAYKDELIRRLQIL